MENCNNCNAILVNGDCILCKMQSCLTCHNIYLEEKCPICPIILNVDCGCGGKEKILEKNYYICKDCGIIDKNVVLSEAWNFQQSTSLPELPKNLKELYCWDNQLPSLIRIHNHHNNHHNIHSHFFNS